MKRDSGAPIVFLVLSYLPVLAILASHACTRSPVKAPADVMVPPVQDAASEQDAAPVDDCEADCRAWRAQGCSEGNPTAGGVTCEQVCRNTADAGIDTAHQLSCAETAQSCATHRACPY